MTNQEYTDLVSKITVEISQQMISLKDKSDLAAESIATYACDIADAVEAEIRQRRS